MTPIFLSPHQKIFFLQLFSKSRAQKMDQHHHIRFLLPIGCDAVMKSFTAGFQPKRFSKLVVMEGSQLAVLPIV